MIISHEHKFIFLKTKKTAGTALEAALSQLCGPLDVITPYREESEQDRKGRAPQNYRIEHPLKPKRSLLRNILMRPERYYHPSVGYYEHMPADRVRMYVGDETWHSYFKFAFDRNPWDRQISWYFYKTKSKRFRPSFDRFMQSRHRAYVQNYEIYSDASGPVVDFLGQYERLEQDLKTVLRHLGIKEATEIPRTNITGTRPDRHDYRKHYTRRRGRWWPTGTSARSRCWATGFKWWARELCHKHAETTP
jgi:hypothetical protein